MPWMTVDDLRGFDPQVLGNATRFTDAQLTEIIEVASAEIEMILGRAFITRTVTNESSLGDGGVILTTKYRPIRTVTSISIDGVALTAGELATCVIDKDGGRIKYPGGFTYEKVVLVTYTHGEETTPPTLLLWACKVLCRERLSAPRSPLSARATRFQPTDGGSWVLDSGGPAKTGVPEVDTIISKYWLDGIG